MFKDMIDKKRIDKGLYWSRAWSIVDGCTKVSEGCDNCWSLSLANRVNPDVVHTEGRGDINWSENIILREDRLDLPLQIKKPTVFAIWNDLFHEKVHIGIGFIGKVIEVIRKCPQHIFLILTKRIEKVKEITDFCNNLDPTTKPDIDNVFSNNAWLGVTIESPKYLWRIDELLKIPVKHRFVSIEPYLERIDLPTTKYNFYDHIQGSSTMAQWKCPKCNKICCCDYVPPECLCLDWIIVGAESGSKRRPCNLDDVKCIRDQCKSTGIPLFIKQIHIDGKLVKDINKFPEDLRIREMPKT